MLLLLNLLLACRLLLLLPLFESEVYPIVLLLPLLRSLSALGSRELLFLPPLSTAESNTTLLTLVVLVPIPATPTVHGNTATGGGQLGAD